jgi:transposase
MITMAIIGKIRRMYFRDGLAISEIVSRTSLARNTVKKWLRAKPGVEPKYRRRAMPHKLTAFAAPLKLMLEADARRPRRDRRTGLALFRQLQADGYTGGYSRLTDCIRQ